MRSGDPSPRTGVPSRPRRLLGAGVVVLAAMLLLATTASAGTLVGESTNISLVTGELSAGSTIVKGTASYDSSGHVDLGITTAAVAGPEIELEGGLFEVQSEEECSFFGIFGGVGALTPGALAVKTKGTEEPVQALIFLGPGEEKELPAGRSYSGTATTTLSVTSPLLADRTYNCALLMAAIQRHGEKEAGGASWMFFPVSPAPATPSGTGGGTATVTAPSVAAPKGPPAALTIAKPKTTTAKAGKWATVRVKVVNNGGTTLTGGSLRVKPVRGVNVKPESQKLPVLAPGASWTVSVNVQLTEKAKAKSTLGLVASGPGATTGTGSLVVKLKQ